jgi:PAP2 superfamily
MNDDALSSGRRENGDCDPRTGVGGFPEEDWSDLFRPAHEVEPSRPLFDPSCLALGPPEVDIGQECLALHRMQARRTAAHEARIRAQVDDAGLLLPFIEVLGLLDYYSDPMRERARLLHQIRENLRQPIFVFKRTYLRARPFRMCPGINPIFSRGSWNYPGHPSYPSGHAAMAYAWAYLFRLNLSERYRDLGAALLAAAKEVAENREWAGVHFASDTRAGELLGLQMAGAIVGQNLISRDEYALLMPGLN